MFELWNQPCAALVSMDISSDGGLLVESLSSARQRLCEWERDWLRLDLPRNDRRNNDVQIDVGGTR